MSGQNGKGHSPRPCLTSTKEFSINWINTFKPKHFNDVIGWYCEKCGRYYPGEMEPNGTDNCWNILCDNGHVIAMFSTM